MGPDSDRILTTGPYGSGSATLQLFLSLFASDLGLLVLFVLLLAVESLLLLNGDESRGRRVPPRL